MSDTQDNFEDDPVKRAQKHSAPELPKRFYKEASMEPRDGRLHLLLDGRTARTPAKNSLAVAHQPFAEQMVAEWAAQQEHINPAHMPYTRLANSAIDGVSVELDAVAEEITNFANSDLLFYRAAEPDELAELQQHHWDPVLDFAKSTYSATFILAKSMMFVEQPQISVEQISKTVSGFKDDALALAGLQVMTSISGSVLIALGATAGFLSGEEAWAAAHVDEDWNISEWGTDEEAQARRAYRWSEFQVALMAARGRGVSDE